MIFFISPGLKLCKIMYCRSSRFPLQMIQEVKVTSKNVYLLMIYIYSMQTAVTKNSYFFRLHGIFAQHNFQLLSVYIRRNTREKE